MPFACHQFNTLLTIKTYDKEKLEKESTILGQEAYKKALIPKIQSFSFF